MSGIPEHLFPLWEKYIYADMDAREIEEKILTDHKPYQQACRDRDAAWEAYREARDKDDKSVGEPPKPA